MFLIQILLPLYRNDGEPVSAHCHGITRSELVERFHGVTAYARAPAIGFWKPNDGAPIRDDLMVLEVMADRLDTAWWQAYRERLEARFEQQYLVIRAHSVTEL